MVEAKGLPAYVEQIHCAFVMTTNHLLLWLEESDRRFFILDFNHEGYANGGADYTRFTKLVAELKSQIRTTKGVKGIYDKLMSRDVPDDFGSKLDVAAHSTEIMTRLRDLSPDVAKQIIEEVLNERGICFVPVAVASQIINKYAPREINSQTHLFSEMGWQKMKLAWSGRPQCWVWVKIIDPDKPPRRGNVYVGNASKTSKVLGLGWVSVNEQVDAVNDLLGANEDVVKGGSFKSLEQTSSGVDGER